MDDAEAMKNLLEAAHAPATYWEERAARAESQNARLRQRLDAIEQAVTLRGLVPSSSIVDEVRSILRGGDDQ
jgi:hypothetical protein